MLFASFSFRQVRLYRNSYGFIYEACCIRFPDGPVSCRTCIGEGHNLVTHSISPDTLNFAILMPQVGSSDGRIALESVARRAPFSQGKLRPVQLSCMHTRQETLAGKSNRYKCGIKGVVANPSGRVAGLRDAPQRELAIIPSCGGTRTMRGVSMDCMRPRVFAVKAPPRFRCPTGLSRGINNRGSLAG